MSLATLVSDIHSLEGGFRGLTGMKCSEFMHYEPSLCFLPEVQFAEYKTLASCFSFLGMPFPL